AVVDQVRREILELLFGELYFLDAADDLVIGEEAFLFPGLDELLELLDLGKSDVDGEHLSAPSGFRGLMKRALREPAPSASLLRLNPLFGRDSITGSDKSEKDFR